MRVFPAHRLMLAPFIVAAILFVSSMLGSVTGFGPSSNVFAEVALITIAAGLIIGTVSLFFVDSLQIWVRLLLWTLYIPAVMFSLLLSGF